MNKIISVDTDRITQVFHISDIHIRNLKRHKEYKQVFNRLYKEIEKRNNGNSLIYVGGDIVHSKTELSPELVEITSNLFRKLSSIAPTIVITGNHDCNLNNSHRLDALSPIIKNIKNKNLHYLKDSGIYEIADCKFVVMSVFDKPENYIQASTFEGDTKIALFHGTVDSSITDFGYRLPSDVKIDVFDNYDIAMLGDLHKHQYLDKEHYIGYAGSLISQNHGEGLDKGFIVWDIPNRKPEFVGIENDYGFYTLDIDNGVIPDVANMPKKARLRIRISNTKSYEIKKVISKIHKLYKPYEITINRVDRLSDQKEWDRQNKINVGDIRNVDYQNELIGNYLERNFPVGDEMIKEIQQINGDLNAQLPEEEISRNINWKLKVFEFDNMFSYGKNNKINFEKFGGVVGVFGPNHIGKSAVLENLSFCLFDTCHRAFKAGDVMNNKKKKFWCKLNFEINGLDYFIERTAKTLKNGSVKVGVDFWMEDEGGEKISLNGDQRRTTNTNIRRIIGTFDDFILTSLSPQGNSTVFIDKTQRERKDLLAQFMDISVFDTLYTMASDEIRDVASLLKDFRKKDYGKELGEAEENLEKLEIEHTELKKDEKLLKSKDKKLNKKIITLTKKLKTIDIDIVDIELLEKSKQNMITKISESKQKLKNAFDNLTNNELQFDDLNITIKEYDDMGINQQFLELVDNKELLAAVENKMNMLKISVRHKLDKLGKMENYQYDDKCNFCVSNAEKFAKEKYELDVGLKKDKEIASELNIERAGYQNKIVNFSGTSEKKNDYDNKVSKSDKISNIIYQLKSDCKTLNTQIELFENQLTTNAENIEKYHKNKKTIEKNNIIENEIVQEQNNLDQITQQLDDLATEIKQVHGQIQVEKSTIKNITEIIEKVKRLEDKLQAYEYYMDAVKRDGIPYELITKIIPLIEQEVNNILAQIVDFSILFELDGKHINTKIVYSDDNFWALELSSGMERFISSIAIRAALINVSSLPRPNFLAIDEGFGTLDADNLNSLTMLFQYLKTQFQFVLVISHIDTLRDVVDTLVEIKKENGYSNIVFS